MNIYLKVFIIVYSILGIYILGSALVTGSIHFKGMGMRTTIRRQKNPGEYWLYFGFFMFVWVIMIWAFLTS